MNFILCVIYQVLKMNLKRVLFQILLRLYFKVYFTFIFWIKGFKSITLKEQISLIKCNFFKVWLLRNVFITQNFENQAISAKEDFFLMFESGHCLSRTQIESVFNVMRFLIFEKPRPWLILFLFNFSQKENICDENATVLRNFIWPKVERHRGWNIKRAAFDINKLAL